MAQQNFGMPQQPVPRHPVAQHPMSPNAAPQYLMPRLPSVVPGILLIVAGALGVLLAIGIIMIPGVLFLLGGGGNVDAFNDFASGFVITAVIVGVMSLAALVTGIVLAVRTAKKRRRIRHAAMGWPTYR
ncbi:MAG: hypothetical protein ACTIBG_14290 [Brevibacterium aurantiacum]|uniref:Uncharacterized protein n=1 Tax=Brevibacterium aurantiacum TaxID=273384 RepID=A0A2A3YSM5_BREAU|nr:MULTISPECIES: hypothetical protein [Brevibacterium]PCC42792.1 hypothetical protein CIK65_10280 [Brevibacterium aurantiacum]